MRALKKLTQIILIAVVFLILNRNSTVNIPVTGLNSTDVPQKLDTFTGTNIDYGVQPGQMTII